MNFWRWLQYRFAEPGRPWNNSDLRCRHWQAGCFNTDWQCLLIWNHAEVEGHDHIYEPDLWPGGVHHDHFMNLWRVYRKEPHGDQDNRDDLRVQ